MTKPGDQGERDGVGDVGSHMRDVGRVGYNRNSTVTPSALAPMEDSDTITPITAPVTTVVIADVRGSGVPNRRLANRGIRGQNQ